MRELELKILSQLIRNSRISDRELARKLGVSQATVSRTRAKLEKEGYIREYTVIPSLSKLGYQIVAVTFVKFRENIDVSEAEKMRKRAEERFQDASFATNVVMFERGMGFGYTGVIVSFHEDYTSFAEFLRMIKQYQVLEQDVKTFLTDLNDKVHYRSLTLTPLAQHILTLINKKEIE